MSDEKPISEMTPEEVVEEIEWRTFSMGAGIKRIVIALIEILDERYDND